MRSANRFVAIILVAIGLALCVGNLWFTASRTTIPLSLDLTVVDTEIRHEKHPGFDDVHLIRASNGNVMVVDGVIYHEIAAGERITKERWSRELTIGEQQVNLNWSADARGMMWAMPTTAAVLVIVAGTLIWRRREWLQNE